MATGVAPVNFAWRGDRTANEGRDETALASFRNVSKTFEIAGTAIAAIRDINLEVSAGQFLTLVGPSGCGKSTLLNLIAGLVLPTQGQVLYRGAPVTGLNRQVGYMTQQDHLLPWRDIASNVAIPLELRSVPKSERLDRVAHLLSLVGLNGFERHYPSQLSGGMRKRAALARLLASDAETLLMDEPFSALDAQLRLMLQAEMLKICRALNKTLLFVTHDLDEAIALADRCIVFGSRPGTIIQEITVDLPKDRDLLGLRFDQTYVRLTQALWSVMAPEAARRSPA